MEVGMATLAPELTVNRDRPHGQRAAHHLHLRVTSSLPGRAPGIKVLITAARQPTPGQTKTRLVPPLSFEQAAELNEGFRRDTLRLAQEEALRVTVLPPWYDVDDQPTLERLIAEVRISAAGVAPHTRSALENMGRLLLDR
jgi:hypothetical protein